MKNEMILGGFLITALNPKIEYSNSTALVFLLKNFFLGKVVYLSVLDEVLSDCP